MPLEVRGLAPLLSVFDMPVAIRFCRGLLGFKVTGSSTPFSDSPDHVNWADARAQRVDNHAYTAYNPDDRPTSPDQGQWSGHSDTSVYFGCPDVEAAHDLLLSKGIDAKPPKVAPYGMKQLYLRDPDAYGLCFQWKA